MKATKKLYKLLLQTNTGITVMRTMAVSEKKAKSNFINQIAYKHNVTRYAVQRIFKDGENYEIIEEVK